MDQQRKKREEKKIKKYSIERHSGRSYPCLIPLVFKHFGCWGNSGEKFLHQISLRSHDEDGKLKSIKFKTHWQRILSSVLAKKIDRIVCSNESVEDSYKHQMAIR